METPENTPKKSSWASDYDVGTPTQPTEHEKSVPTTPQTPNRILGSLVRLTQNFVDLMIKNGGTIDIRDAAEILEVQKRRIYDITNVLDGIGLIEKTHSSVVRWRSSSGLDGNEYDSCRSLKEYSSQLEAMEADLDLQLEYAKRNLKYVKDDETNRSFAYVTRDDLVAVFGEDCVFAIPKHYEDEKIIRRKNALQISLDNGSTIDVRLVTDQGRCCTTKPESESVRHYSRLETPSPTLSSSSTHSATTGTLTQTTTKANLVNDEHTYFCNPEVKEEMEALENKLTARIILQKCTKGHSLRRFFPDDPHMENPPLLPLNPPQNDYTFVLSPDEGICELYDIPCP